MATNYSLRLTTGTSRAKATPGYRRACITDKRTGASFRAVSDTHDVTAIALAKWANTTLQDSLVRLAQNAYADASCPRVVITDDNSGDSVAFFGRHSAGEANLTEGLEYNISRGQAWIDGKYGLFQVTNIISQAGATVEQTTGNPGPDDGFEVRVP